MQLTQDLLIILMYVRHTVHMHSPSCAIVQFGDIETLYKRDLCMCSVCTKRGQDYFSGLLFDHGLVSQGCILWDTIPSTRISKLALHVHYSCSLSPQLHCFPLLAALKVTWLQQLKVFRKGTKKTGVLLKRKCPRMAQQ